MCNNVLVSIIIPVYNVRPYLQEALNSVINQTYQNLEIIIIDDGSTDGSEIICDEYQKKDNRIIVVHQENKGLSGARNTGLDLMKGKAVAFLDSDDAYHPQFIETLLSTMSREDSDIVICQYTIQNTLREMYICANDKAIPVFQESLYDRTQALRALVEGSINHSVWNKLYNNSLWGNIRFPEGCVYEDIDTTYRIINASRKVYAINRPLYLYRRRLGSITYNNSLENRFDCFQAYSHFEEFVTTNEKTVFTAKHVNRVCQLKLQQMIILYVNQAGHSLQYSKVSREKIIEVGDRVGTSDCILRIRIAYWLIRFCPVIIKHARSIYYLCRYLNRLSFRNYGENCIYL